MSLRLPQAPAQYDPSDQNELRSTMEEILGHLFRSTSSLEDIVEIENPAGSIEFIIAASGEVTARITPLANTLSFGYTVGTAAFNVNRSAGTLRNFASATTPYDQSLGVLTAGDVRYVGLVLSSS